MVRPTTLPWASAICLLVCLHSWAQEAQRASESAPDALATASSSVPRLIRFSGVLKDMAGKPLSGLVDVGFSLYAEQEGGTPLWWERQTVEADAQGRYVVLLGAMQAEGLPEEVFASVKARWLEVQVEGGYTRPRILLVSVPYALKAGDAETLGGKRASDYLLAEELGDKARTVVSVGVLKDGQRAESSELTAAAPGLPPSAISVGASTFTCDSSGTCVTVTQNGGGIGLYAESKPASGILFGLYGRSNSSNGRGVTGYTSATSGLTFGVRGQSDSTSGYGVYGLAAAGSGITFGVRGDVMSTSGRGVWGNASATSGQTYGVLGFVASTQGVGVLGQATAGSGYTVGVRGISNSSAGAAGVFDNLAGGKLISAHSTGFVEKFSVDGSGNVAAGGNVTAGSFVGPLTGSASDLNCASCVSAGELGFDPATQGELDTHKGSGDHDARYALVLHGHDVLQVTNAARLNGSNTFTANMEISASGAGSTALLAQATDTSTLNEGVHGVAAGVDGTGLVGEANNGSLAWGVWGFSLSGLAGQFSGDVNVTGTLTATSKNFVIDHPLDPANKLLYHASVESSEMKTIYDGTVVLDTNGEAVVELPDWLEALNGDFRYQLTCVGGYAPVFVAEEIHGNRFTIAGGSAGLKVSWQVTGIRHDAFAKAHPLRVEVEKAPKEQGYYRHPAVFGTPEEKGMDWALRPGHMRRMKGKRPSFVPLEPPR